MRGTLPLLGLAAAWAFVLWLGGDRDEPPPAPPEPPKPPKAITWRLLGDPIALATGRRYRGCLSVPWPLSPSPSTVVAKAEGAGFRDVRVWTSPPSGWPAVECKHYVEATWGAPAKSLDVPGVVKLAWEALA